MTYTDSIQELLEEKEGKQTQFKEAKTTLILATQPNAAAPWQIMVAVSLSLVLQIRDLVVWLGARHSSNRSARVWGLLTN